MVDPDAAMPALQSQGENRGTVSETRSRAASTLTSGPLLIQTEPTVVVMPD
jgi:hypothetical protein